MMEHKNDRTVHGTGLRLLKGKRHTAVVAVVLMIIALIILHAAAARSIYKAGGFPLKGTYSYWMIGGLLVLVAFKLFLFVAIQKQHSKTS
jgi:uncharacterized membrane protein YphA (DoxX/SURF4 family)